MPAELVALLAPLLPSLLKLGDRALEKAGEKAADGAVAAAHKLWAKLWPRLRSTRRGAGAVHGLAEQPDDDDLRAALEAEVDTLLRHNNGLRQDVARLLSDLRPIEIRGDHNRVHEGKYNVVMRDGQHIHFGDINR
jgi:hypothetical protein